MTGDSFSFGPYNSLDDWGIAVIAHDTFLPPKRERKLSIPGRSGAYDYGAKNWEERTLRIECSLMRQITKAEFREIVYILSRKNRLRLWNEPDKYYVAELYDSADVLDYYLESMRDFELTFVCEPFAYGSILTVPLASGRNQVNYGGTAETPTVIVLKNTSETEATNVTITAIKRS